MIMNKFIMPGRIIFALGFIALGVLQLIAGDFIIGRPPAAAWAAHIPGKLAWACASGCFLIVAGSASFAFAGIMFTLAGLSSNNNTELV
jgi:hypothetical protein